MKKLATIAAMMQMTGGAQAHVFRETEARTIIDYFRNKAAEPIGTGPEPAKRDLPADLVKKLPSPAEGTERLLTGTDVVLVDTASGKTLDVLRDAAKPVPGGTQKQS